MNLKIGNESRPRLLHVVLLFLWFGCVMVQGAKLNPTGWSLVNPALTDNNLSTFTTNTQITIDFGVTNTVDRVYLTGTNRALQYWPNYSTASSDAPVGFAVVLAGNTPSPNKVMGNFALPYDSGTNPCDTEIDIRFSPMACRYVTIQFQTNLPVRVAELEIYGVPGLCTNRDCVVESTNTVSTANAPLDLAAADLSYYLTELEGYAVPIVPPSQTNLYPGTIYNIRDLKPLAPDYATMTSNIANGSLPTNVTVLKSGREVIFTGWPYRVVDWSVWTFLNDQGVRWVYPSAQGEYVPRGAGVSLSDLPINYSPSAQSIYANFDAGSLEPWPSYQHQTLRQSYLYLWRNFWNGTWNANTPLGGAEVPSLPSTGGTINSNFTEGFGGFPHNFNNVVPTRILDQHPEWWGWTSTSSASATESQDKPVYQVDNPSLIAWVAQKLTNVAAVEPPASTHPLNVAARYDAINLLPLDASTWSEDPYTVASNAPPETNSIPWVQTMYGASYSGAYYSFVNAVAAQASRWGYSGLVGALAYANVFAPPSAIPVFPTNVWVDVCLYGAPNLPMTAPANDAMKAALAAWHSRCQHLATYDYALLQTDYWQTNDLLPVPLVAGIVGTARYLAGIGALNGSCQATIPSIQYNPWNFYAWSQIRWNTNQTAAVIESNFFHAYYRESAAPMLAYYQAIENYQNDYDVDLHLAGYCYGVIPGAYPLSVLYQMQTNLALAESEATNWVTISRIADQTNAFAWLLAQRGLTGVNLTNLVLYPTVPTTTFTVDLTNMVLFNNTAAGNFAHWETGGYWWFGAQSLIKQTLNFPQAGTYNVSLTAYAVPSAGIYPVLTAYLGPDKESQAITSASYSNYSYTLTVPYPGAWDLALQYQNAAPGGARQIYINQIQITKVAGGSAIQVTPNSVGFGTISSGTSKVSSFTVENVGGGTLSGTASVSAPFSIVSGGTYNLTSNQSQAVTLSFNPTTAGNYSQNVTLTGGGGATVAVSGSATNAPVPPAIQANPGSVSFGSILSGSSKTGSFTVKNAGGSTLSGTATVGAPFSIVSGGSYNLGANASQTVTVAFNPTAAGNYNQNVILTGGGGATVAVSGSATIAPVPPAILVSRTSLPFGATLSGTSLTGSFTVQNTGGSTLSGSATVGAPFSILSGGTYNLGTNQSQTVTVAFNPTSAGNYSQNVTLTGGGGATVTVSGSATNAPVPPAVQVSPGSVAFGTILGGTSKTGTFTVKNIGGGTLSGTASVGSPFSILPNASYNLTSNQSQTITVAFNPTSAGNYSQNVTLTGGGGATVAVSGSATNAPIVPTVSAISLDVTDVDSNLAGLQIYTGTIVHFSATATNAQTWQWSYAVNHGSPVIYTNSTSPITNISYFFNTNMAGNNFVWTLTVSNGLAWTQSQTNLLVEAAPNQGGTATTNYITGPTISATSGSLSGLLTASTTINGVPTTYFYQPLFFIGSTTGGTATYNVTLTNAGNYEIEALAYAPNANAGSFLVNIDGRPQSPSMLWDVTPYTSTGFEQRVVSWRGNGSPGNDQFTPKIFNLSAGVHQIVFVGSQPGTALASFNLVQAVTSVQSPPPAPTGLRVLSSSP